MNLNDAKAMAIDLMRQHGLMDGNTYDYENWSVKFDRSVKRLGLCQYGRRTISLSGHATSVNDEKTVRNTILHEIAHALAGSAAGHGPVWRAKALEIGCDGNRCGNIAVKAPHRWEVECGDCGYIFKYYRKPCIGPFHIHKCQKLLQRVGYVPGKPWVPSGTNLKVKVVA